MMKKVKVTSGLLQEIFLSSSRGTQCRTVHAERKIMSHPAEVHRRYQNSTYITRCIVGENIDDYWTWMEKRELSDAWTGFIRFILLNEMPPEGYTWSWERLTRKQTTSRVDDVWPDMWKHMSDAAKKKAKQRWAIEKPKLDNARQWRCIFFIKPDDEEFKTIMKTLVESWKFRCHQQCFVKHK